MYIFWGYFLSSIFIFSLDQIVKAWVVSNIPLGETVSFLPNFLSLTYVRNTGAAWSLMDNQAWFMYFNIGLSAVVICVALFYLKKNEHKNPWFNASLALIIAGAAGNAVDRIHLGYVVDMFQTEFINFPIFNVADIALNVGVVCMLIYVFMQEKAEKRGRQDGK